MFLSKISLTNPKVQHIYPCRKKRFNNNVNSGNESKKKESKFDKPKIYSKNPSAIIILR